MWSDQERMEYLELAASGDLQAQIYVGNAFMQGDEIYKDEEKAAYWLGKAEEQGSSIASFRLAFLFVYRGKKEGVERLINLEKKGFSPASYELGNCYYVGQSVQRDVEKAAAAWRNAARRGHLLASVKLYKYRAESSAIAIKPLFIICALFYTIRSMIAVSKNADDIRVLGALE